MHMPRRAGWLVGVSRVSSSIMEKAIRRRSRYLELVSIFLIFCHHCLVVFWLWLVVFVSAFFLFF